MLSVHIKNTLTHTHRHKRHTTHSVIYHGEKNKPVADVFFESLCLDSEKKKKEKRKIINTYIDDKTK
jgi:hypothetical protein